MNSLNQRLPVVLSLIFVLSALAITIDACQEPEPNEVKEIQPIKESEIIAFQKAYGISFNAIAKAIEDESYYESAARAHIDKNYNFEEGKVMFKIGNDEDVPFRYTYDGLLSYLIGKNKKFPKDEGIANQNWRKIEWNNNGITIEGNIAMVIGKVKMVNEENDEEIHQNYTMGLKRNRHGHLKLIVHKISLSCD